MNEAKTAEKSDSNKEEKPVDNENPLTDQGKGDDEEAPTNEQSPTIKIQPETPASESKQNDQTVIERTEADDGTVETVRTHTEIAPAGARPLALEPYIRQKPKWPQTGKHILAQYDNDSVVVYQAYKAEIAEYAVENQQFGGPHYKFTRMSWIKTSFLWMMYRCGWATKENQEHVLAIRITRDGFDEILSCAFTPKSEKEQEERPENVVRLQWDPDHSPNGGNLQRRAIQLGLKGDMLVRFANEFIVSIEDITEMVKEQNYNATKGCIVKLLTPRERVYHVEDEEVAKRIGVDLWEENDDDDTEGFEHVA